MQIYTENLSNASTWPAWVQAVGSVTAILVAFIVPWWQRRKARADALEAAAQFENSHLRRLVAALGVEIDEAVNASTRQEAGMRRTLAQFARAKEKGANLISPSPVHPDAMQVTDAIIYRQAAAEIGRLPESLVKLVIKFYSTAGEINRITAIQGSFESTLTSLVHLAPRLRMFGALALHAIEKFRQADFALDADLAARPDETRTMAASVGYPMDEVLAERGLS